MASSGNFCTWNPLRVNQQTQTFAEGNTRFSSTQTSTNPAVTGTFGVTSGKWYWEIKIVNYGNASNSVGVCRTSAGLEGDTTALWNATGDVVFMYLAGGNKRTNGTSSSYGNSWTTGDILQVALDMDNGAVYFGKNNTFQNSGDPTSGSSKTGAAFTNLADKGHIQPYSLVYSNGDQAVNFGQDDTFGGRETAASNADANGKGVFKYSPPSGFLALCTANLPIDSDIDPAQTDDDHPVKVCNAVAYTGTGTARTVSGFGFQPDMVWIKNRASPGDQAHRIVDSSRGVSKAMISEDTQQENTETTAIQSFLDDGFSIGTALGGYNTNTGTYIAWGWKANGGTTSTNTSGTVTTTVQASTAGGFSILTYTGGNGSWGSTNRDTIGHGLSAAPEFMLFKERNNTDMWTVFHHEVGAGGGTTAAHNNLRLDNTEALYTNQSYKSFGGVMPTSTVITVEGNTTNSSTSNHIAYIWHGVEGYSKFGKFDGNNNNDGVHVYTGFRPRIIFIKSIDQAGEWVVYDTARNIDNPVDSVLNWDNSIAESANDSTRAIDVLSNGFKLRTSNITINNTNTYVFGAWGDVPFKYNNVHAQS